MKVWSWRQAVAKARLESSTKLVLYTLANYMNEHGGGCYPTIATIAEESSMSDRTVRTHLKLAAEAGFITITKHGFVGQEWANNEYQASYPEGYTIGKEGAATITAPSEQQTLHIDEKISQEGAATITAPSLQHNDKGAATIAGASDEGAATDDTKVRQPLPTNSPEITSKREEEAASSPENINGVNAQHLEGAVAIIQAFDEERVKVFGAAHARPYPHAKDHYNAGMLVVDGADVALCRRVFFRKFTERKARGHSPVDHIGYLMNPVRDEIQLWKQNGGAAAARAKQDSAAPVTQLPAELTLETLGGDTHWNKVLFRILKALQQIHGESIYRSWFIHLRVGQPSGSVLHLTMPSRFQADHIRQRYDTDITKLAKQILPGISTVTVTHR